MRTTINYCINCGAKYDFQWSGNYDAFPDIPKEHRDKDYCPECKKAIVDALALIEKKSEIKWLPTNEVDIDTLLKWEEQKRQREIEEDKQNPNKLPIMRRVFASLYDTTTMEHSKQGQIMNLDNRRLYSYSFFPSRKDNAHISVQARVKFGTDEIIDYR